MDNMSKSNYRVFQILMQMYNFRMVIRRAKVWGFLVNGSWTGVVGLLNRTEMDISISGLRWESDRYGVFDQTTNSFYVELEFSCSIYLWQTLRLFNSRILFIFRHPKTVDAMNVYLSPFVGLIWLLVFMTAIVTSVLIRNFFLLENKLTISNTEVTTSNDDTYYNSFLMIFGILFQQGNLVIV